MEKNKTKTRGMGKLNLIIFSPLFFSHISLLSTLCQCLAVITELGQFRCAPLMDGYFAGCFKGMLSRSPLPFPSLRLLLCRTSAATLNERGGVELLLSLSFFFSFLFLSLFSVYKSEFSSLGGLKRLAC